MIFASGLESGFGSCASSAAGPQTYLSVHSGLGRPFISNVERGQKELCLRSLEILALAFELSLSQFLKGV